MNLTYKITSADQSIGQIQVTFYDENNMPVGNYAIDIPIVNGAFISGPELDARIMQVAPTWHAQRKVDVATAAGFDSIVASVELEPMTYYPLDALKNQKSILVNQYREQILSNGVVYNGNTFDSDVVSVSRLTTVSNLVLAGVSLPEGFVWRSKNNVDVPFTGADVVALLGAMVMTANSVYATSWAKKQEINAATTKAELFAVEWQDPRLSTKLTGVSLKTMTPVTGAEVIRVVRVES
jgi:hypothetical protein